MASLRRLLLCLLLSPGLALEWWESANYYQVYPRSFKDSDGDGVGDLQGVISKVPYLQSLGMNGVWLSPIMKSPMVDHGYDISDYLDIDPLFGTLKDFEELLQACKQHDIHLILDFVPNHTSDQHEWFKKSEDEVEGFEDYYVWHPGKNGGPPNNWLSVMKGPAWTWSEKRRAYYYHAFSKAQPDLNYRNPKVVEEMKNVLRFWLQKGVSGFRIDAVPNLFEAAPDENGNFPDEPLSGQCENDQDFCYLNHIHVMDQPETLDMVYQWRQVLDERDYGEPKLMMTEADPPLNVLAQYYTNGTHEGAQIPFNFKMIFNLDRNSRARDWRQVAESYLNVVPRGYLPNWVLGNHDRDRIASRLGSTRVDLFNVFLQTMPGNAITYQGEEIGMTNANISWEQTVDPQACNTNRSVYFLYSRDPVRTPFQWDNSTNAGFSSSPNPWLPVNPNYVHLNVRFQESDLRSSLGIFKRLTKLRQKPAFRTGLYLSAKDVDEDILAYVREADGETYLVILNLGSTQKTYKQHFSGIERDLRGLPKRQKVVLDTSFRYSEGIILETADMVLEQESALILEPQSGSRAATWSLALLVTSIISSLFQLFGK